MYNDVDEHGFDLTWSIWPVMLIPNQEMISIVQTNISLLMKSRKKEAMLKAATENNHPDCILAALLKLLSSLQSFTACPSVQQSAT